MSFSFNPFPLALEAFTTAEYDQCIAMLCKDDSHDARVLRTRCFIANANYTEALDSIQAAYWKARRSGTTLNIAESAMLLALVTHRLEGFHEAQPMFAEARAHVLGTDNDDLLLEIINYQGSSAITSGYVEIADQLTQIPLLKGNASHRARARTTRAVVRQTVGDLPAGIALQSQIIEDLTREPAGSYLMAHAIWQLIRATLQIGQFQELSRMKRLADEFEWPTGLSQMKARTYLDIAETALAVGRRTIFNEALVIARQASRSQSTMIGAYSLLARQAVIDRRPSDLLDALSLLADVLNGKKLIDEESLLDFYLLITDISVEHLTSAKFLLARADELKPSFNLGGPAARDRTSAIREFAVGSIQAAQGNTQSAFFNVDNAFRHLKSFGIVEIAGMAAIVLATITGDRYFFDEAAVIAREHPGGSIESRLQNLTVDILQR